MNFDYIKVLHSPFTYRFYIGELSKGQPCEVERALDRKLEILGLRAGSTANSPDNLHKTFPSLSLSLPICTMAN